MIQVDGSVQGPFNIVMRTLNPIANNTEYYYFYADLTQQQFSQAKDAIIAYLWAHFALTPWLLAHKVGNLSLIKPLN